MRPCSPIYRRSPASESDSWSALPAIHSPAPRIRCSRREIDRIRSVQATCGSIASAAPMARWRWSSGSRRLHAAPRWLSDRASSIGAARAPTRRARSGWSKDRSPRSYNAPLRRLHRGRHSATPLWTPGRYRELRIRIAAGKWSRVQAASCSTIGYRGATPEDHLLPRTIRDTPAQRRTVECGLLGLRDGGEVHAAARKREFGRGPENGRRSLREHRILLESNRHLPRTEEERVGPGERHTSEIVIDCVVRPSNERNAVEEESLRVGSELNCAEHQTSRFAAAFCLIAGADVVDRRRPLR